MLDGGYLKAYILFKEKHGYLWTVVQKRCLLMVDSYETPLFVTMLNEAIICINLPKLHNDGLLSVFDGGDCPQLNDCWLTY